MVQFLNISIALIVFMGMVSGGMLALVLMTIRKLQLAFSVILGLALLLALTGVYTAAAYVDNSASGLANALVLLILSFGLGYTLTTFSVLSWSNKTKGPTNRQQGQTERTAVIYMAAGEPPEYGVESASRRLALTDDPQDAPPVLLRPFYLKDLRSKYKHIGRSPYREYHTELARKVQSRLDNNHRVYISFYSDQPTLAEAVSSAISDGVGRIVLVHVRVTRPPEAVSSGELLGGLKPENYGVKMLEVGPFWDAELLPQIYVRRVLEAVPQVDANPEDIGLLLLGRGHAQQSTSEKSGLSRYNQEQTFQNRLRHEFIKMGFHESRVAIGWLRGREPSVVEAFNSLVKVGCKSVLWMPSTFPADGINTLYDMASQLGPLATSLGVKLTSLGAWNADELAAEEIAARVRAATPARGQVLVK